MVLDPFISPKATAKACLLDLRHRTFSGFDTGCKCVVERMPPLLHVFVEEVLNSESDITESAEVHKAGK